MLARICAESFATDQHTRVKQLGEKQYDMEDITRQCLHNTLSIDKYVYVKAVDDDTGDVVGCIGCLFWGIDIKRVPKSNPGKPESKVDNGENSREPPGQGKVNLTEKDAEMDEDSISRLCAMENADMKHWQEVLMPPGTKCMIVVAFYVDPRFQSRGCGSAMLKWVTGVADRLGVFLWAHSSEGAWKTFERHGFNVVGTLDIDLDTWAPSPPKNEGEGEIWGHYVCRYMKRPVETT